MRSADELPLVRAFLKASLILLGATLFSTKTEVLKTLLLKTLLLKTLLLKTLLTKTLVIPVIKDDSIRHMAKNGGTICP